MSDDEIPHVDPRWIWAAAFGSYFARQSVGIMYDHKTGDAAVDHAERAVGEYHRRRLEMPPSDPDVVIAEPIDADGYPSEEVLEKIRRWPLPRIGEILPYVMKLWHFPSYASVEAEGAEMHLSTGGWSGNESLISAMESNIMFWVMHWKSSAVGGHYIFKTQSGFRTG